MLFKRFFGIVIFSGFFLVLFPVSIWAGPVVIDPGHGGGDSGAVGPSGFPEKTANLDIGRRTANLLRARGIQVILTREGDVSPNSPPRDLTGDGRISVADDLQARVNIANRAKARVFVSIHNNAGPSSARGTETYYWSAAGYSASGRKLAEVIQKELVAEIGRLNRGVKGANFYVLRRTNMPSALVEAAFISNPTEELLLKTPSFRQKIATAVARGIGIYLNLPRREPKVKKIKLRRHRRITLPINKYFYNKGVGAKIVSNLPVIAERSMYFKSSGMTGGSRTTGARSVGRNWYFAEGFTGNGFDTWLVLVNPRSKKTAVRITYMTDRGLRKWHKIILRGKSRHSVHANKFIPNRSFSIKVTARRPIVAERTIYFKSAGRLGGHSTIGTKRVSRKWYFAGGYQVDHHDTWLLVSNPTSSRVRATINYRSANSASAGNQEMVIPARGRRSIHVNAQTPEPVSIIVSGSSGIVAERSVYFTSGGETGVNNTFGSIRPSKKWLFAEEKAKTRYNGQLMLWNLSSKPANVAVEYLRAGSGKATQSSLVPAGNSMMIQTGTASTRGIITRVISNQPTLAEKSNYFNYSGYQGGHSSSGLRTRSKRWLFAEGFTGDGFNTKLTIANPNRKTAYIRVYFYK